MYDLITLGEAMIRFSPPDFERLEQAPRWQVRVGGAEWNVASNCARLGLNTAWISRLTDNPLGWRIAADARAHGVDTHHVVWTEEDRIGVYFLEPGPAPRGSQVIYDRANSAASKLRPDDLDLSIFAQARAVHLSGITPALSDGCRDATWQALTPQQAAQTLQPFCEQASMVVMSRSDAGLLFEAKGTPREIVAALRERFGPRDIVLTIGAAGSCALSADGSFYEVPHPDTTEIDRVGAGDSFVAGVLYGLLREHSLQTALAYGGALAAYKLTIPGDAAMCSRAELEALVAGELGGLRR